MVARLSRESKPHGVGDSGSQREKRQKMWNLNGEQPRAAQRAAEWLLGCWWRGRQMNLRKPLEEEGSEG